jgi:hypothetical protein
MTTTPSRSASICFALLGALSLAPTIRASCTTANDVETEDYQPSDPSVKIMDSDTSPTIRYTTTTAVQAGAIATLAQVSGSTWTSGCSGDDKLDIVYSATGSGTLPSPATLTSVAPSVGGVSLNGVGRTFNSTTEALEFAVAMLSAKLLPSGVTLTESGGSITITSDLEETWVSP